MRCYGAITGLVAGLIAFAAGSITKKEKVQTGK